MADFALGLAKTAVEGTLSRVQTAIDEENTLQAAARQDLAFITGEFQMMQSFLEVASKDRVRNKVVKILVRQLRDLAFDVEDCVEFVIHLDNESTWKWVWRMVPSCIAPPRTRDLDDAVGELKQLKVRVEEVSQRNTRYNLISDSGSNPVPHSPAVQLATTSPSRMDILMELWEANGKHRGFCTLQKLISTEGNALQVISLMGSAGSDTEGTQIINKAYCDPKICHLFKTRAWVRLTHPFNPDKFLKNLRTRLQASSQSRQAVNFKGKILEDDPMKQLAEQRYLVILEGISSVVEWEIIRLYLPDNNNGSRIVVSTKQIGDAIFLAGRPYRVSVLRELTDGHYLCAFYNKIHGYMDELFWRLRHHHVIAVGGAVGETTLLKQVHDGINNQHVGFKELEKFECCTWVDVPHSFKSRYQFEWHLEDKWNLSRTKKCILIINGLQSMEQWESIKPYNVERYTGSRIILIANEESVAIHLEHLKANTATRPLTKASDYYGYGHNKEASRSTFLSNKMEVTPLIASQVEAFDKIRKILHSNGFASVWGIAGVGKSTLVRGLYTERMFGCSVIGKFAWVDVPDPFDLVEFSRLLLLDLHRCDLQAMEAAAIGIMQGQDPIQGCREILHQDGYLIIIDGLRSTYDWDLIETTFLYRPTTNVRIVVITAEESIAKHSVKQQADQMINVKCVADGEACDIFNKVRLIALKHCHALFPEIFSLFLFSIK
ncbi:unnamed protein product [Triticum turgidum subsp. durum]|uniref:Uncharacterized protein n=1 Tax=Triticum turgidum subsp. durum TaxID=4567 RepID=A0A9R1RV48_TRITD|nr:unnamed protein product [Triticum turgidum subsp. durum]